MSRTVGSPVALARALYGKGRLEEKRGHLGRARYYKERALKLLENCEEKTTSLKLLISLGANAFSMRDTACAVDFFSRAVAMARETGNVPMEGVALANIGGVYIEKPDLLAAESSLMKARDILEGIGDMKMLARVYNNLSMISGQRGMFEEAVGQARAGLEVAGRLGEPLVMAKSLAYLGSALKSSGRMEEAASTLERALELAGKAGSKPLEKEIVKEFYALGLRTRHA